MWSDNIRYRKQWKQYSCNKEIQRNKKMMREKQRLETITLAFFHLAHIPNFMHFSMNDISSVRGREKNVMHFEEIAEIYGNVCN